MHDNDTKHIAKMCRNYLRQLEENSNVKITVQPPQCLDLNPIEKLWDHSDRQDRKRCPRSEKHLWDVLQSEWKLIDSEVMKKLTAISIVIKAHGGVYTDEKNI